MAKHNCAICGAEVGLLSEQKLADGNYICRKVCSKKCFKIFDRVAASLKDVTEHIAQIEQGTKAWEQIFVPLQKTKEKEEKLRQLYGVRDGLIYVSPSTGLMAFLENRYTFFVFGKSTFACVYRLADLVSYVYENEKHTNSEGKEEVKHFCRFGFDNTEGMSNFRVEVGTANDFTNIEEYFNELFGIQKTKENVFNNIHRQIDAVKAAAQAAKGIKNDTLDEEQAEDIIGTMKAAVLGDRTQWAAKADAALSKIK